MIDTTDFKAPQRVSEIGLTYISRFKPIVKITGAMDAWNCFRSNWQYRTDLIKFITSKQNQ